MNAEMLTLPRWLYCAAGIYMLFRFFKSMFPCRVRREKLVFAFPVITTLIFLENSIEWSWVNVITVPISCFFFVISVFQISLLSGIAYMIIFCSIFSGGGIVCGIIYRFLSANLSLPIAAWFPETAISFRVADYAFRFLFLLCLERFTVKPEAGRQQKFPGRLLILPLSSMMILKSLSYMEFPGETAVQGLLCGGALLLYFSNAAIFIELEKYSIALGRIKNEELFRIKQTMEDNHFQNIAALNESYRSYMHDIHHYFSSIRVLALKGQTQTIVSMIDEIEGGMQEEIDGRIYSGNQVLNAILAERQARARRRGIDLDIFVEHFLKVDFISDADMVSLFGNLLDNAMEAAEKCGEGKREVKVKLFMGNQYMLVLYIENNYETIVRKNDRELLTTKEKAAGHGLGIGIVRKLAEKYGGTLDLEERDGLFRTILTISANKPDGD